MKLVLFLNLITLSSAPIYAIDNSTKPQSIKQSSSNIIDSFMENNKVAEVKATDLVNNFVFINEDIKNLVEYFNSLLGKQTYILDKSTKGKLTIIADDGITVTELLKLFNLKLKEAGYRVKPEGPFLKISR